MNKLSDKERQYSALLKYKKSTKKSNNNFLVLLLILTFVILLLFAILVFMMKKSSVPFSELGQFLQDKSGKAGTLFGDGAKKYNFNIFNRKQNILLLGVDSNGFDADPFDGTRSDTIIVLNVDPATKTINAVSIPRDSKVYIADNNGIQKINAAHAIGGVELTKKTLEQTLGVHIDKYVIVNTEGVRKLVDAIDGVPVYVEKDMRYHDYAGKLHVELKKGMQVMDGKTAESYIRFRHDTMGDISRTSRQQWFLRSLLKKLQTPEIIPKVPEVLNVANKYCKTDLTLYEMSHLVALMRSIDMSQIEVATLPGAPSQKGYISYWILEPEQTQAVLDRLIYRTKTKMPEKLLTAGLVYAYSKEAEAMEIKSQLQEAGYDVSCIGRAQLPHSQIIAHNADVSSEFVKWLKKKIPELKSSQFVYDPIKIYCNESDFTIIIAD